MTISDRTSYVRQCTRVAVICALLLLGGSVPGAEAQRTGPRAISASSFPQLTLGHIEHAVALSEQRARNAPRPLWTPAPAPPGRRWPFRADPRRWPRLFANTTECTLSFDPVLRRHWW